VKNITLNKRKEIQKLQDNWVSIADGVNIIGDGTTVVHCDEFPLKHSFADGVYIRQMDMKKGSAVVGHIHNHEHVWFLLTGNLAVATEKTVEEYIAPCYVIAQPGSKRVIYALEDSIFVNIHKNPSNTKDIEELEKDIVSTTFEKYEEYINKNK
jgi:quercetin dioxygenase-like cupin family protein